MPKFVTIGYGDENGYAKTPEDLRAAAHAHDKSLIERGVLMGIAGKPVQVRNTLRKGIETKDGAYLTSKLPIAGFAVIDADDISHAIKIVSDSPCAVAYGVVEVWPLEHTR